MNRHALTPQQAVAHLQPRIWSAVNRRMVAKAIGEFAHERLIVPDLTHRDAAWGHYVLRSDDSRTEYRFSARRFCLDHWSVDPDSIRRFTSEGETAPDAVALIVELRERLALPEQVLPAYLEEITSTLYSAAFVEAQPRSSAATLARSDFQTVETSMSAGHPIFVANHGRVGFDACDYRMHAPEVANPVCLIWLAAIKTRADFACVGDLSYVELMQEELGVQTLEAFERTLQEAGRDPLAYVFIPVHPWQWQNRLSQLFAADLAAGDLVCLGTGPDQYFAQQSIRTLFNISRPEKRYVKTALSIVNMGFTRGLSAAIAKSAAAVNDWVAKLVRDDAYLTRLGFRVLREVAFTGFRHRHYERAVTQRIHPYKELLGALWRENPRTRVRPGQQIMTMAALMHRDSEGASLLAALISASGVNTDAWLRAYLRCYLTPQLHCFYRYNLVFTPHCENVILVLEEQFPVALFIKDISEDIGVLNPETPLPDAVHRLALSVPEEAMTLSIFTDIFDCVFRFLAALLSEELAYPEAKFWRAVADCVHDYERQQPLLADRFRRYDLFAPTFALNCLNRLQLANNRQMLDLNASAPVDCLRFAGNLENPIAPFRVRSVRSTQPENSHENS